MGDSVRRHVTDPAALKGISADLSRFVGTPNQQNPSLA
jgi:hypothetical protein